LGPLAALGTSDMLGSLDVLIQLNGRLMKTEDSIVFSMIFLGEGSESAPNKIWPRARPRTAARNAMNKLRFFIATILLC
jgi:hypothetical protein